MMRDNNENIPQTEVSYDDDSKESVGNINAWMMRPCEWYKQEYYDCKSLKAKWHQLFIYGQRLDCSDWWRDYQDCINYRKKKDVDSLNKVVESELKRINDRLSASKANDVWEYRKEPPKEWATPLPEFITRNNQHSFLRFRQQQINKEKKKENEEKR